MPRLSLWREQKGNDYKFLDRRISEMYTVGGTGVLVHKYLGINTQANTGDVTKPAYNEVNPLNIQDLLFLENRDRKYDTSVYTMRGIYQMQDQDFDLSQFGIFLAQGTIFMTFHLNDMIELLGRKIMSGDVLELQHLEDLHSLDPSVPYALKRFYVVSDATRAAEGFSPTWYPHIWRVKLQPLVDSQEYKDILNSISADSDPFTANASANPLADIISTYQKYLDIGDAVVEQAEAELPKSGYDTSHLYTVPVNELRSIGDPTGDKANSDNLTADSKNIKSSSNRDVSPNKITGYLTQDGTAPNGYTVGTGISFPTNPIKDEFFLRLDYVPNRLFRFDGKRWIKVEDALRTSLTPGPLNQTPRSRFVNNTNTWETDDGSTLEERQSLSQALKPKADN
jgi:hypothetical protein